jgi:hypothetical protein
MMALRHDGRHRPRIVCDNASFYAGPRLGASLQLRRSAIAGLPTMPMTTDTIFKLLAERGTGL